MIRELEIVRPDDWHLHLRDGTILKAVLPYTSKTFGRAIVMPNLTPPITSVEEAIMYKNRISAACPDDHSFKPLMTIYLTESTDRMDIAEGFSRNLISAVKLYPAGATTNSSDGVHNFKKLYKVFEKMEEIGSVEYGDWNMLGGIVSDDEVTRIKEYFTNDLKRLKEDEGNEVDDCSQLYMSVLYCKSIYVWSGMVF